MKSSITALTTVTSDIPLIDLIQAVTEMDQHKISSIETAVEAITDIIVNASEKLNVSKSEILAEVMKSCLLSSDENPNHINGMELISQCDCCFNT